MTDQPQMTPAEATAKLTTLKADAEWSKNFLAGNGPQVSEFQTLLAIAHTDRHANEIEMAVAGQLYNSAAGQPSGHMENVATASMLREAGLSDDVIRQAVRKDPVSQAEHDIAKREKAALMRDRDFAAKYLAANGPEVERMALLNVILCAPIKAEKSEQAA